MTIINWFTEIIPDNRYTMSSPIKVLTVLFRFMFYEDRIFYNFYKVLFHEKDFLKLFNNSWKEEID